MNALDPLPDAMLEKYEPLAAWNILSAFRGSIAHGTWEPNYEPNSVDDKDAIGICVPPVDYYLGLRQFGRKGTLEIMDDPWDVVVYEALKAINLLKKGNPNILSMLWLPDDLYLEITPAGRLLIESRDIFATQVTYLPFVGFARSNLLKMERGANLGYMGEKRKRLVEKHGYDTKNAAHLIRLLRMSVEFLGDGVMRVRRDDAAELLEIKHGEWPLEKIKAEADRLFGEAEQAKLNSPLPQHSDSDAINDLAVRVVKQTLHQRGELDGGGTDGP